MNRSLFTLAVAGIALAAALPASAGIDVVSHPDAGAWNLAEAYPCSVGVHEGTAPTGIAPLQTYCPGTIGNSLITTGATPGILALQRKGLALDVNCFAVARAGEFNCAVQAYRLTKMVPGSYKCPDVYGLPHFHKDSNGNDVLDPYMYFQFGSGVRTWWSLNFTQPGTRFLLEVVVACQSYSQFLKDANGNIVYQKDDKGNFVLDANGQKIPVKVAGATQTVTLHMDQWRWRVVANVATLANVIELMHGGAVSTLEVPCILGEDMYDALVTARGKLAAAIKTRDDAVTDIAKLEALTDIGNKIFDMEALVVANCLFVEVLNPLVAFPGPDQFGAPNIQPPSNLAQTVFFGQGSAVAGIIDTIENPCCCKLLVDLEWIALKNGIIGQPPVLPHDF